MTQEKPERNKEILFQRDVEGRTFWWIAEYLSKKYGEKKMAIKNVAKIYHREKAKAAASKGQEASV